MEKQGNRVFKATTLGEFQARVHAWAVSKGFAQPEINSAQSAVAEVESKLARIALAHRELDYLAERVRIDPTTDVTHLPLTAPEVNGALSGGDCNKTKVLAKLALVHTEVTEAVDAVLGHGKKSWTNKDRKNDSGQEKPEGLASELVDINFRCNQLAAELSVDLSEATELKMAFNDGRPYKHGKHA